jgi:glycosyltransferase involved in cell wall biosynthesis
VIVGSRWVKKDVARQYGVSPKKIQVIPEGPPTQSYAKPSEESLAAVTNKYKLEQPFVIYPSVTWQHKNHIRLLEALAYLRDSRGLIVRLVCTGTLDAYWPQIERRVGELDLSQQVQFLGFVPEADLRCLYRLSQCLVMPSLFEAVSLPIFEAWFEGTPVACSNVTALPEQVLDAGLIFDPHDAASIADAIAKLVADPMLRQDLVSRGYRRLQDFDCQRTAKAYRAVYRSAAGVALTEEDRRLLRWDWMRQPSGKMQAASASSATESMI